MGLHIADLEPLFPVRPDGAEPLRLFAFPGQGTQAIGMGADLYSERTGSPTFRRVADEGFNALLRDESVDLRQIIFGESKDQLNRTLHTQPAIVIMGSAYYRHLVDEEGMLVGTNDLYAGHSAGEWTAYVAAGDLSLAHAARAVYWRGRFMEEVFPFDASQGKPMAAIMGVARDVVEEVCEQVSREGHIVVSANYNHPTQIVISGDPAAVQEASDRLSARGATRVVPLSVAGPFHSPLMGPVGQQLRTKLDELGIRIPGTTHRVIANITGDVMPLQADHLGSLIRQITGAVRWSASMMRAWELGVVQMVPIEVGGNVLAGLAKNIFSHAAPVDIVDPRNPLHQHSLRVLPGVFRVTSYELPQEERDDRTLRYSYNAAAVTSLVQALITKGDEASIQRALVVLKNKMNASRIAGLRVLESIKGHPLVQAAMSAAALEWPGPEIFDLETVSFSSEKLAELQIIYTAVREKNLAPVSFEIFAYYFASRWAGEEQRLKDILDKLRKNILSRDAKKLPLLPYGPKLKPGQEETEDEKTARQEKEKELARKGVSTWDDLIYYLDCVTQCSYLGAMRKSEVNEDLGELV